MCIRVDSAERRRGTPDLALPRKKMTAPVPEHWSRQQHNPRWGGIVYGQVIAEDPRRQATRRGSCGALDRADWKGSETTGR